MNQPERQTSTRTALKEWAVATEALGKGEQILLLRKGGIREEHRDFRIEHPEFLLFPTFEHQRSDLLKPNARQDLESVLTARPPVDRLLIRFWASVVKVFDLTDPRQVLTIAPFHLWSDDYALDRLRWKPRQPLQLIALRILRLPQAVDLPLRPEYGGCKSWLTLAESVSVESARAVLDDQQFGAALGRLEQALQSAEVPVP